MIVRLVFGRSCRWDMDNDAGKRKVSTEDLN